MLNRRRFLAVLAGAGLPLVRMPRGFGGAAGCRWMVDPVRRGMMVFMTQRMPDPENLPLWNELHAAVDADLG